MTQQEFETLTQVNVNSSEFDAINRVYMDSDVDKETFCKFWCKINKSRVLAAKVDRIEAEREAANREFAWRITTNGYTIDEMGQLADNFFNTYEKTMLKRIGIEMQETNAYGIPHFITVSDTLFKAHPYLCPHNA